MSEALVPALPAGRPGEGRAARRGRGRAARGDRPTRGPRPSSGSWSFSRPRSPTGGRGRRTGKPWGSFWPGARLGA